MNLEILERQYGDLKKDCQINVNLIVELKKKEQILRVSINQMEGGMKVYQDLIEKERKTLKELLKPQN